MPDMSRDVFEVIRTRKSVRAYLPAPVDHKVLRDIMEAARLAPSGGNGQGWAFGIVTDDDVKQQLARVAGGQMWIATAPVIIACCSPLFLPSELTGYAREVNERRFGKSLLEHLEDSPSLYDMALLFQNSATAIPGTHITLAARAYGLDTCWIGDLDVKAASGIMGLPEDWRCFFLITLGYRAGEPRERGRKTLNEIVFVNRWGGQLPAE